MTRQNNFYQLRLGPPGTAKSEVLQGQYAKLILPAAIYDYVDVVVTYVESWTTVHVQLANAYGMLQKLQEPLQQTYRTTKSLPNPTLGSAGILKYYLQNECYRVLMIKRIDPTLVLVRFVDFGNTDVATKQLIHPLSGNLTDLPAQAFPIRIELKHSLAGSMSLNAFRKYLTNAQVIVQLGDKIENDSFTGVIYLIDENNRWYWMNEAIKSKIAIKKLKTNLNDKANEEVLVYSSDNLNKQPVQKMIKPTGKLDGLENADGQKMTDEQKNNDDQMNDNEWKSAKLDQSKQLELANDNKNSNDGSRFIVQNLGRKENQIMIDKGYKEANSDSPKRGYKNQRKNSLTATYVSENGHHRKVENQPMNEARERKRNRKELYKHQESKNDEKMERFLLGNNQKSNSIINKASCLTTRKDDILEGSIISSQITDSNYCKNASKEENESAAVDDKLTVEDLGSMIGSMAYGSLKNDTDNNLRRTYDNRISRQHAGRSVNDFDMPSSSTYIDHIKSSREISEVVAKNHDSTLSSSISEDEIQAYSENFTSESINDGDHSDFSANTRLSTRSDIANREQNGKLENRSRKNYQKNVTVMEIEMSTSDEESFPEVSPTLSSSRSTRSDTSSEALSTNMTGSEITQHSDDQSMVALSQRLTDNWTRNNTISDYRNLNDSYDSTQQNSTFQWNDLQGEPISQTLSIHQSNSVSRVFPFHHSVPRTSPLFQSNSDPRTSPLCQSSSVSRGSSVRHIPSVFPQTIHNIPNENIGQKKYPFANSIHSSDFQIPSYLNTVPTLSHSQQQFTYGASRKWMCSQRINGIRELSPTVSERTNSIETHKSNDRIYSKSTLSTAILPKCQFEKISRRFSKVADIDKFLSESFCQTEGAQMCHRSEKHTSMLSTIPLTRQTSTISDGSGKCTNFESSIPYKLSVKNQQVNNFCNIFEQSIQSSPRTDAKIIHPGLPEITPTSSENSEIPSCLNLGNWRKFPGAKVQMEQSSSAEGLKMKMNIVLAPKRHQSSDECIGIEEQQSDRETNPTRSISSLDSITTITTYESTRELPTSGS